MLDTSSNSWTGDVRLQASRLFLLSTCGSPKSGRSINEPPGNSPPKQFGTQHRPERGWKQHAGYIPDAPERRTHLGAMKAVDRKSVV